MLVYNEMLHILVSLKKEIDSFLPALEGLHRAREGACILHAGSVSGKPVVVIKTGIGKNVLAPGILRQCSFMVSTGFCGALAAGLKTGDIVLSDKVAFAPETAGEEIGLHAGICTQIEREPPGTAQVEQSGITLTDRNLTLSEAAEKLIRKAGIPILRGPTITVSRIVRSPEEKKRLALSSGSLSLEMEDYFRLELACQLGIPFISVRAVLDELDEWVPRFRSGLRSPARAAAFLKKANACSRRIAEVLLLLVQNPETLATT